MNLGELFGGGSLPPETMLLMALPLMGSVLLFILAFAVGGGKGAGIGAAAGIGAGLLGVGGLMVIVAARRRDDLDHAVAVL